MLQIVLCVSVITVGTLFLIKRRMRRRRELEQRQLEMFIEALVWDPDEARWMVDSDDDKKKA